MKHFFIIDDIKNGDSFGGDKPLNLSKEEAVNKLHSEWDAMSEYDKGRRSAFYLCFADAEDGCCDLNTAEIIEEMK